MKLERTPWTHGNPWKFQCFEGASPKEILEHLINLPGERGTKKAEKAAAEFLKLRGPLRSGYDSPSAILGQRDSFRSFWIIDEWPVGARKFGQEAKGSILCGLLNSWPHPDPKIGGELSKGSWAVNWETGTVYIRALDPLATLAHYVFENRRRLRKCKNPDCCSLFISNTPRGDYCPRPECAVWARRTRHNRSYHKTKKRAPAKRGKQ